MSTLNEGQKVIFAFLARDLALDAERKSLRFGVAALIEERREGR
jgi:hypothetical protein